MVPIGAIMAAHTNSDPFLSCTDPLDSSDLGAKWWRLTPASELRASPADTPAFWKVSLCDQLMSFKSFLHRSFPITDI